MKTLRILLLNHNVAYSGGATFYRAYHLGRGLAKRLHQVTLIASSPRRVWRFQEQEVDGMRLVESPGIFPTRWRYGYDPYETIRRLAWVAKESYDIVHAFDNRPTALYPALAAKKRASYLVMDWCDWFGRGGAVEQRSNPALRYLLRSVDTYYEETFRHRADATTVINTALEERARRLGVVPGSIHRLPNGVDPEQIILIGRDSARFALGLPIDVPILGYEGSLFTSDANLLSEAFSLIRKAQPRALLLLIGNPKINLPSEENVIRTGFVPPQGLNQYLAACDVLCLPLSDTLANRGRWPSKLGDYLASGRPIVACAVGDVKTTLQETQAGLLTQPNPTDFASAILNLLDDPGLGAQLGANAGRAAEIQYNWASLTDQVESLYSRLLASQPYRHQTD